MHKIDWSPSDAGLRKFGWTILIGFGLIGGLMMWRGHAVGARLTWGTAGAVGLLALAWPRASLPFYRLWMGIGFVIGSVTSRVVMAVIFYGAITPLSLFFRLTGRDALKLKKSGESFWTEHPRIDDPSYYDHLF